MFWTAWCDVTDDVRTRFTNWTMSSLVSSPSGNSLRSNSRTTMAWLEHTVSTFMMFHLRSMQLDSSLCFATKTTKTRSFQKQQEENMLSLGIHGEVLATFSNYRLSQIANRALAKSFRGIIAWDLLLNKDLGWCRYFSQTRALTSWK